jgi:hypothetical protein
MEQYRYQLAAFKSGIPQTPTNAALWQSLLKLEANF